MPVDALGEIEIHGAEGEQLRRRDRAARRAVEQRRRNQS